MSELFHLFAQVFDSLQIALAPRVSVGLSGFRSVWPANRIEGLGYDRVDVCVDGLARVSLIAELTAVSCLGLRL